MYDKGNNLRIKVTINNPREFKVQKENEYVKKDGETEVIKNGRKIISSVLIYTRKDLLNT